VYVIPPSHIEVVLPMAIVVWLFFFIPRFKRKKMPRNLAAYVLVLSTIALLALQMFSPNDIPAYEEGEIVQIGQISNYYVLRTTSIMLQTNDDVKVYLVDESSPEERHNEVTLTDSDNWVFVKLPYLYTDETTIANWSLNFENPNTTHSVNMHLNWDPIEDNLYFEHESVRYWPYMPIRILITLWVFFSLGFVASSKPTMFADRLAYQNIRLLGYFGVWIAIFGGLFLWSLAELPQFIGLGLPAIAILWVFLAESTFKSNRKDVPDYEHLQQIDQIESEK